MPEQTEIHLEPSRLRTFIWSIAMVTIVVVAGIMLWRAYQKKQAAIISETDVAAETSKKSSDARETTPGQETDDPAISREENDEFVAREDTTVTFPPPPDNVNDSDPWLRDQLPLIDPDPAFKHWVDDTPDLLRQFVLLASEVARGKVPHKAFSYWAPRGPFKAKEVAAGQYVIDPASYHRYDALTEVINAIDIELAWRMYRHVKPLVDEAYAEFAPSGNHFDQVLLTAVEHLLKTPQPRKEVRLIKPSVVYKFADPRLESLSAAQKQLLRMGAVNGTIVKHKLGLLRGLLLQELGQASGVE